MDHVVVVLHGFLGRPQDFYFLKNSQADFLFLDYFNDPVMGPHVDLKNWGRIFNSYLAELTPNAKKRSLIGYSLGGRLALHALCDPTSIWQKGVAVAAGLGLPESELVLRHEQDQVWAEKFLTKDWGEVVAEWNQQPLFKGSLSEPVRKEADYKKDILVKAFLNWAQTKQRNFVSEIAELNIPFCYIYGELDQRYKQIAQRLPKSAQVHEVKQAAHRVFMDQPTELKEIITRFLSL